MAFSLILCSFFSCESSDEDQKLIEDLQRVNLILEDKIKYLEERNKSLLIKCEKQLEDCKNEKL